MPITQIHMRVEMDGVLVVLPTLTIGLQPIQLMVLMELHLMFIALLVTLKQLQKMELIPTLKVNIMELV